MAQVENNVDNKNYDVLPLMHALTQLQAVNGVYLENLEAMEDDMIQLHQLEDQVFNGEIESTSNPTGKKTNLMQQKKALA